jgi:hypothetical protein
MANEDRVAELMAKLGEEARVLDALARAADVAAHRQDVDALCDVAERMLQRHVRWAELYRTLLVAHAGRGTRSAPVPVGLGGSGL